MHKILYYSRINTSTCSIFLEKKRKWFSITDQRAYSNLSNSENIDEKQGDSNINCTFSSFNLLSKMSESKRTINVNQQSLLIEKLRKKLENNLGISQKKSIAQIDKQYYFQKKSEPSESIQSPFHKTMNKMFKKKQNKFLQADITFKNKKKRFKSCESANEESKRNTSKECYVRSKKKHPSMDFFDYCTPKKVSLLKDVSNKKSTVQQNSSNSTIIKEKIQGIKDKIKKQKENLRKRKTSTNIHNERDTPSKKGTICEKFNFHRKTAKKQ